MIPPFLALVFVLGFFFPPRRGRWQYLPCFFFKKQKRWLSICEDLIIYIRHRLLCVYGLLCHVYIFSLASIFSPYHFLTRTLFKFMKKFEAVLSEPCRSSLIESDKEQQPDFLLQSTEVVTSEVSPIQRLNKALRETLLARPVAAQVLACGIVLAYSWASQMGSILSV